MEAYPQLPAYKPPSASASSSSVADSLSGLDFMNFGSQNNNNKPTSSGLDDLPAYGSPAAATPAYKLSTSAGGGSPSYPAYPKQQQQPSPTPSGSIPSDFFSSVSSSTPSTDAGASPLFHPQQRTAMSEPSSNTTGALYSSASLGSAVSAQPSTQQAASSPYNSAASSAPSYPAVDPYFQQQQLALQQQQQRERELQQQREREMQQQRELQQREMQQQQQREREQREREMQQQRERELQQQQQRELLLQQQQQLQQQREREMQQQQQQKAYAPVVAPSGAQDINTLLGNYPNPHTENEKLRQLVETMSQQLNAHFKRMEYFTQSMDSRLCALEAAMKDLSKSSRSRESGSSSRDRDRKRSKPPKEEKETKQLETDEELAKKLQQQFNAEVSTPAEPVMDKQISADEDYAQRLQAMYVKRDMARVAKEKRKSGTISRSDGAALKAKDEDKKAGEDKPTLWSRLFGAPAGGAGGDDDDDDDSEQELKPMTSKKSGTTTTAPKTVTTVGTPYPGALGATTPGATMQPMQVAAPYGFYPQPQPFMTHAMPGYHPQYLPVGATYAVAPAPTSPTTH